MYERSCKGCGNEFQTTNYKQIRCSRECGKETTRNQARKLRRIENDIDFIAVDGEGVDRPDGAHEYVMLSVGNKTLWKDGRELTLAEILTFLYECYTEEPDAAYVGFFLGYDFIQWEKHLPQDRAWYLLKEEGIAKRKSSRKSRVNPYPDPVVWEGWEIDIMAGRRFKLRPHVHHKSDYTGLCRNRTCGELMEITSSMIHPGESVNIIPGENDFVPPDECASEIFTGNAKTFWEYYTPSRLHTVGRGKEQIKAHGWMYICDTGPFWQTSFLNVIKPSNWKDSSGNINGVCTLAEFETIERGKRDRGNSYDYGDNRYFEEMRMYNVLENEILARVTTRLNEGFMNSGIPIKIPKTDWYGPGRAAQLWMDQLHALCADPTRVEANRTRARNPELLSSTQRHNETGLLNADVYMSMPSYFIDAAQASYYGGWFEQFIHGHCGDVWEYDINSAYPYIIASLPCLHTTGKHNGEYRNGVGEPPRFGSNVFVLVYAKVSGSNSFIGAMPYRSKNGLISRPSVTEGWYWLHELHAATRASLVDEIQIQEWCAYIPCDCSPPFDPESIGISKLYQARLDFGKNTPQGKSAKLVYNSAYGKTAQSIGTPKFSNPVYASLITAGCRTLILQSIASHPDGAKSVSMVATDGVYFTRPHPRLRLDDKLLGAWDHTAKPGMTQLMPGVYWDDSTRERIRNELSPQLKSRGVNAKDLAKQIFYLDELFTKAKMDLAKGKDFEWPEIQFKVNFLLDSAKTALQRGKWETAGRVTHGTSRSISSSPHTKRLTHPYLDPHTGFIRTYPIPNHKDIRSTPYDRSFGYQELDPTSGIFGDGISRDGDDGMAYFRDLIKGT